MDNVDFSITNSFIFDFDSTIVSIETLDTIIKNKVTDEDVKNGIDDITRRCMNGEIDFNTSLNSRISMTKLTFTDFDNMGKKIVDYINPGIEKVIEFLHEKEQKIFIISGGFVSSVVPAAEKLGISIANCFANDYVADDKENVIGVMETPMAFDKGKVHIVKNLREHHALPGRVIMIGDGITDYEVYEEKMADVFIGCGFVVERPKVKELAKYFVNTPQELLSLFNEFK